MLEENGEYHGLDIDPLMITLCRQHYQDSRAKFSVLGERSPFYSLDNAQAQSEMQLDTVCSGSAWDMIVAKALFDHLTPADLERYIAIFQRGLTERGLVIATFFLLDEDFARNRERLSKRFRFDAEHPKAAGFHYSPGLNAMPEAQLGIESVRLSELLAIVGLQIICTIPGTWRDPQGHRGVDMPDTVLIGKVSA